MQRLGGQNGFMIIRFCLFWISLTEEESDSSSERYNNNVNDEDNEEFRLVGNIFIHSQISARPQELM